LLEDLLAYFRQKLFIPWVHSASKQEFLPNHEASLISLLVEIIRLVDTTAPDSNHVIVGLDGCVDDVGAIFISDSRLKDVDWDKISSFGKDGRAIDFEIEASSVWSRLPIRTFSFFSYGVLNKLHGTETEVFLDALPVVFDLN
jgi:hypothetical protein